MVEAGDGAGLVAGGRWRGEKGEDTAWWLLTVFEIVRLYAGRVHTEIDDGSPDTV